MINKDSSFTDRLKAFIKNPNQDVDLSNGIFETATFITIWAIFTMIYFISHIVLVVTFVVWGPIYIIVKLIIDKVTSKHDGGDIEN